MNGEATWWLSAQVVKSFMKTFMEAKEVKKDIYDILVFQK